jgi:hypothetical protein
VMMYTSVESLVLRIICNRVKYCRIAASWLWVSVSKRDCLWYLVKKNFFSRKGKTLHICCSNFWKFKRDGLWHRVENFFFSRKGKTLCFVPTFKIQKRWPVIPCRKFFFSRIGKALCVLPTFEN